MGESIYEESEDYAASRKQSMKPDQELSQKEWRVLVRDLALFYFVASLLLAGIAFALGFVLGGGL